MAQETDVLFYAWSGIFSWPPKVTVTKGFVMAQETDVLFYAWSGIFS